MRDEDWDTFAPEPDEELDDLKARIRALPEGTILSIGKRFPSGWICGSLYLRSGNGVRYISAGRDDSPGPTLHQACMGSDAFEVRSVSVDEADRLRAENERLREALGRYPGTPEGLDDLRCDLHSTIHGWEQTSCDDSAHEDYVDDLVTSIIELLGSAAASLSETGGEDEREWHCEAVAVGLVSDAGECSPEQQIHNAPCGWRP